MYHGFQMLPSLVQKINICGKLDVCENHRGILDNKLKAKLFKNAMRRNSFNKSFLSKYQTNSPAKSIDVTYLGFPLMALLTCERKNERILSCRVYGFIDFSK